MKNETVKKGRIKRFITEEISRLGATALLLLCIGMVFVSIFIGVNISFGGFNKIYSGYPEQQYLKLEEEFNRIIVDNQYINMERLSDKDIEYTKTFIKSNSYPEKTWEIVLEKGDAKLASSIIRSEEGKLEVIYYREISEAGFKFLRTIKLIIVLCFGIVISLIPWTVIVICCIIAKEKRITLKNKPNSVSNQDDNS